jgi:hypothetical protein
MEAHPDIGKKINDLISGGMEANQAILTVIDRMKVPPDPNLADNGQGGVGALTARYPGNIPVTSIVRVYTLVDDDPFIIWPPTEAQKVPRRTY